MPELPEVETVRRGLQELITDSKIDRVEVKNSRLRFPVPRNINSKLRGEQIISIERRAKYLMLKTTGPTFLSHLGMTGSWRIVAEDGSRKHDHLLVHLSDGRKLCYNDPRRFGFVDVLPAGTELTSKWFSHLGPEPLDTKLFHGQYLKQRSRGRKVAVKTFTMDQKVVVGVGNIYACEALFLAGIKPSRSVARMSTEQWHSLVLTIRKVLRAAIRAGGTTIRDFRQAGGSEGYFQQKLLVYGRKGKPCRKCGSVILAKVIGGRNTFWCPSCQQ